MHNRAKTRMLRTPAWGRIFLTAMLATGVMMGPLAMPAFAENTHVSGTVVDAKTGEPLIGVSVMLENTTKGAKTNLSGKFIIRDVAVDSCTLVVSSMGYATTRIEGVEVKKEGTDLTIALTSSVIDVQKQVVVRAKRTQNTEAGLLRDRQASVAVKDAISAQAISRSGSSNAAQAMSRVTGATTDGRYVYIRGLGDRYANTQLNGSILPTPDPEKQAVPLDLVPSELLDNIVVTKSFTADMSGNFSGGSVNLVTKDFPERRMFSFSAGSSYNSVFTGKEVIGNSRSSTDWLGYDDGTRAIPDFIKNNLDRVPTYFSYYSKPRDSQQALFLDSLCRAFRPEFSPKKMQAPLNQNFALSYGDNLPLFGRPLGVIGSLAYDRSQMAYTGGRQTMYVALTSTSLDTINDFTDDRGVDNVLWGGLGSANYSLATNHTIGVRYVYNRNGYSETRFLRGPMKDFDPNQTYESHDADYIERTLRSIQVSGNHQLNLGLPVKIEWKYSDSKTVQKETLRQFVTSITVDSTTTPWDTLQLSIIGSIFPAVYWRDINEKNHEFNLDLRVPLTKQTSVKFGGSYLDKERTFRQIILKFNAPGDTLLRSLHGDLDAWAASSGLTDSTGRYYTFQNPVIRFPSTSNEYDGSQKIPAWYVMLETPLVKNLRLSAGIRHERTDMQSLSLELQPGGGRINTSAYLPSLNLVYALTSTMNLRTAYSRTLARPNLREIARFRSTDFAASKYYYGNDSLRITRITNYDLRWEWFMRPGEILAASAFYKEFIDPIEIAYTNDNWDRYPTNSPTARNYGLEFEFRKRFDRFTHYLTNFNMGGNLTLVHSAIKIPESELMVMRGLDPQISDTRPMANQSPYIANIMVGYDNAAKGTAATLLYNVFGRRFYYNAPGGAPDIYEMPRPLLDMTFSQKVFYGITLKASAKNLLNSHFEADYLYLGSGQKTVFRRYDLGRSFSIGFNYRIS